MAMFSTKRAPRKAAKRLGLKRSAVAVDETRAIAKHYLKKYDKTFRNLAK